MDPKQLGLAALSRGSPQSAPPLIARLPPTRALIEAARHSTGSVASRKQPERPDPRSARVRGRRC